MRPAYATQFNIRPEGGLIASEILRQVKKEMASWVADSYSRRHNQEIEFPLDGGTIRPLPGHQIEVRPHVADTGESVWVATWQHPDAEDAGVTWNSRCVLAAAEGQVELSLFTAVSSSQFQVRPFQFVPARPRLVKRLVNRLPCYVGNRRVSAVGLVVDGSRVDDFIERDLASPERRLAAVVLAPRFDDDTLSVDADTLADRLAGLAEVYRLRDRNAMVTLSARLSRFLSCINGGVRIYWPGFSTRDDAMDHPLWVRAKLDGMASAGVRIEEVLARQLAEFATIHLGEGPVTQAAHRKISESEKRKFMGLRNELELKRSGEEQIRAEAQKLIALNEQLQKNLDEERTLKLAAEVEVASLRQVLADAKTWQKETPMPVEHEATAPAPLDDSFQTVAEALAQAGKDFHRRLHVLDSARKSAEDSHSNKAEDVFAALQAIWEVGSTYFETKALGESMGPWEEAFRRLGVEYHSHESKTTMSKYGNQRTFYLNGRRIVMEKHITISPNDHTNCVQIFFEVNEAAKEVLVGYCGGHLDTDTMGT